MTTENNVTTIAKDFRWEMGHRLPYHAGACRNIHGHSYQLRVALTGVPDERGMVMDYFDLASIVEPIVQELDHAFLCDEKDASMLQVLRSENMKHVVTSFYTTAENLAVWLIDRITASLPPAHTYHALTIRVCETEKTYAEVSRSFLA